MAAWDATMKARAAAAAAARTGGAHTLYETCFAPVPADHVEEPGFPAEMPFYFRHTSLLTNHQHARSLMRLRCCSTPFAACPTLHTRAPTTCTRCAAARPETAEHALLDCPAYADLRTDERFAELFEEQRPPPPPESRLRAFVVQPRQPQLAAFVHACFERRTG